MCHVFEGIKFSDVSPTMRAALVGIKGDFEFHVEVGHLNRSYQNVGTVNERPFCPECSAGEPGVPPFQIQANPAWLSTCYTRDPWDDTPLLNQIPFGGSRLSPVYRRDAFHTLKFGFLKDLAAGLIILLAEMKYFDWPGDPTGLDHRLNRAYSVFKMWLLAEGKCCTLRKFSRANLHKEKKRQFPFLSGKGADSVVCISFLAFYVKLQMLELQDASHRQLLGAVLETLEGALTYMGIYHTHGLFMPKSCAQLLLKSGHRLLRGYCFLAGHCMQQNMKLFNLRPKVNFFHHFLTDLEALIAQAPEHASIFNYAGVFNCEANEDWIGRVSRISRKVSPRLPIRRTIGRYLVACRLYFKKAGV